MDGKRAKDALQIPARATYCGYLFQLTSLRTCDGRPLGLIHSDCLSSNARTDASLVIEPGVWIGEDEEWFTSDEQPRCVEATVQAFFDGHAASHPGSIIRFKAHRDGHVEIIVP